VLLDLAAGLPHLDLPRHLGVDTAGDEVEGVHVLDLRARAQLVRAGRPHRDVGVDAERPLLHLRVRDAEFDDRLPEQLQEALRLVGRVDVRRRHDLDQRRPAAVEVDERVDGAADPAAPAADVRRLRRILFEVRPDDADLVITVRPRDEHLAVDARR
jgi:hypothetical protein